MNICFYAYGFDHIMIEKIRQNTKFTSHFSTTNYFIIADNRTHMDEYVKYYDTVLYLSDIDKKKAAIDSFSPSNNYHLGMKRYTLMDMPSYFQENVHHQMSVLVKEFLDEYKIDVLIFPQEIQSMEAVMINEIALEKNIKSFVPHSSRIEFRSFFNNSHEEIFPVINSEISPDAQRKAEEIIQEFYATSKIPYPVSRNVYFSKKSIASRILNRMKRTLVYKEEIEWADLVWAFYAQLKIFKKIKSIRSKINMNASVTIRSMEKLPEKFIYFPLQIFPEASLNLRNPFFKDQLRVIDLIRYAMPLDCKLILKEHPWMADKRDKKFYKTIQHLSGVRLVNVDLSTHELIKKSALTISVSGTACFEAFLLGKPSLTIAKTASSWMTNTLPINYNNFKETLKNYMDKKITSEEIHSKLSLYLSNLYSFNALTCEFDINYSLSEININSFVTALIDFNQKYYNNRARNTNPSNN